MALVFLHFASLVSHSMGVNLYALLLLKSDFFLTIAAVVLFTLLGIARVVVFVACSDIMQLTCGRAHSSHSYYSTQFTFPKLTSFVNALDSRASFHLAISNVTLPVTFYGCLCGSVKVRMSCFIVEFYGNA